MDRNTISRFHVSRNSWGAQAERMVCSELNKLPMDRFIVAHDIKFKYGNIDHLVIRVVDGRIFIIETKSYRGKISTDGRHVFVNGSLPKKNPICQVQMAIRYIRDWMRKMGYGQMRWIQGLIVAPFCTKVYGSATLNCIRVGTIQDVLSTLK